MKTTNADRNLLFGFLALQNGLLSREDLLAATSIWLQDKSLPLEQILLEKEILSEEDYKMLLPLVGRHLATHDGNADRSLAAVEAASSVKEDLQRLGDEDIDASLVRASELRCEQDNATRTLFWTPKSPNARFQVLRVHAKGGLGVVSIALDGELKREVAFKEIQKKYANDEDGRSRFLREAEITGGLEHPGIVPVYALGRHEDGRPYYAMRLVKGEDLRKAIKRFHEATNQSPSQKSLALRQLLRRFVDVCNAIEYAHSRGVIHRDIKPANIMLGKYGETLVVDWGLAKPIGRSQEQRKNDEETLQPTSNDSSDTRFGSAVGTPSFMSPEQAAGRLDKQGPRSDVYGLGATLYSILVGQPPLHESNEGTAIRRAQLGDFPPPRNINSSVSPSLQAICLKAMALDPSNRYASARELMAEIERWIAFEKVDAYQEPLIERISRVARRHRSWVATGVLAMVLVTVSSAGAALLINSAWHRTELALSREQSARKEMQHQLLVANLERISAQSLAMRNELPVKSLLFAKSATTESRDRLGYVLQSAYDSLIKALGTVGGTPIGRVPSGVPCLVTGRDSRWIAAGDAAGNIHVLPVSTEFDTIPNAISFPGHTASINCLAVSPDSRWLVSGSSDQTIRLWDLTQRGFPVGTSLVSGEVGDIKLLAISPSGKWLVSASRDATAQLWDLHSSNPHSPVKNLDGHTDNILRVEISPNDRWAATASADGFTRLWDLNNLEAAPVILRGHTRHVDALDFSPDGSWVATASWDSTIRIWNLESQEISESTMVLQGHPRAVGALRFTRDSHRLVSSGDDNTVRIWNLKAPKMLPTILQGKYPLRVSSDGRWLAAGADDGSIRLWNLNAENPALTEILLRGHDGEITSMEFTPNGRWLVTGSRDGGVRSWKLDSSNPAGVYPIVLSGHQTNQSGLAISRDGRRLARADWDNNVRVWDISDVNAPSFIDLHHPSRDGVAGAQFGKVGSELFTLSGDPGHSTIRRWDLKTEPPRFEDLANLESASRLAISPSYDWLAVSHPNGTVRVWRIADAGELQGEISIQVKKATKPPFICFPKEEECLYIGFHDGVVSKWNFAHDGDKAAEIRSMEEPITAFAVKGNGSQVAVGGKSGSICLIRIQGNEVQSEQYLSRKGESISSLLFTPDGQFLISGHGEIFAAKLWGLEDELSKPLIIRGGSMEHSSGVGRRLMFSRMVVTPDSRWLISGDQPHLWDLNLDKLMSHADYKAGKELTVDELSRMLFNTSQPK